MRRFVYLCGIFLFALLVLPSQCGTTPARADIPLDRSNRGLPVAPQNGPRFALVVSCQKYGDNALSKPHADADAVAKTLTDLGWTVERILDANEATLRAALKKFGDKLDSNSVGLFYFTGLGGASKGTTFIAPIDFSTTSEAEFTSHSVSEKEIMEAMARAGRRIIILDGGRRFFSKNSQLEKLALLPTLPPNTMVAYASAIGHDGYEINAQPVSPYARRLTEGLTQKDASFVSLFVEVGRQVTTDIKAWDKDTEQIPEFRHNFSTDFLTAATKTTFPPVFVRNNPKPAPVRPAPIVIPPPVVPKPKPVVAANETGEKWALLIGVEQYQSDDIRALNFTLRDVAALQKTLPLTGFAPDHILAMTSDLPNKSLNYPTNTNILKRLKTLKKQLNEEDTLLIYFSGHGFQEQEGGQNFLGSVNADITDSALLKKTTVSIEELREALGGLKASQLILIMDCCRNNPFKKDTAKGGTDANTRTSSLTKDLSLVSDSVGKKIGTAILFACQEGQRSWEDPDAQQGAFTVFLLEALQGKATRDGTLTVTDLASYVEKRMKAWCIQTGKDQSPDYEQHNRARIVLQEGPSAP